MSELQIITGSEGPIARVDFKFFNNKVYNIKPLMALPNCGFYPQGWYAKPKKSPDPWLEYRSPDKDAILINDDYNFEIKWYEVPFVASVV